MDPTLDKDTEAGGHARPRQLRRASASIALACAIQGAYYLYAVLTDEEWRSTNGLVVVGMICALLACTAVRIRQGRWVRRALCGLIYLDLLYVGMCILGVSAITEHHSAWIVFPSGIALVSAITYACVLLSSVVREGKERCG